MKIAIFVAVFFLVGSLIVPACSSVSAHKDQNTVQTRERFKPGPWEQELDIA